MATCDSGTVPQGGGSVIEWVDNNPIPTMIGFGALVYGIRKSKKRR